LLRSDFEPARVKPKLAYESRRPDDWPHNGTASAFNWLGQCDSSPGNRAYCYAELAVSSLVVTETIGSTHCTYNGEMARLSRPGWLVNYQDHHQTALPLIVIATIWLQLTTHLSTPERMKSRVSLVIWPTADGLPRWLAP